MLAAMIMRALGADVQGLSYLPTSGGKDALLQLQLAKADVLISGYGEAREGLGNGQIRPLAVSSTHAQFGISSLREQGVHTEVANWRGVFASAAIDGPAKSRLRLAVARAMDTPVWRQTLLDNHWTPSPLQGADLEDFVQFERAMALVVTSMLKLK